MAHGWLTPDNPAPALKDYRVRLPDSDQLRAIFFGAFLLMCNEENWQEFGTMTPAQAASLFEQCWRDTYTTGTGIEEV